MDTGAHTELDLFSAIEQGSEAALHELVARIERRVRWQLGYAGEADVQEVCDRVRDKLEVLRARGFSGSAVTFRAYLSRVVATQVVDVRRERARLVSLEAVVELPRGGTKTLQEIAAEMIDRDADAGEQLGRREQRELVRQALAQLDDRCRELLVQREVDGNPERVIGARLGLTVTNVAVSLHRCRERLYRLLVAGQGRALDRTWEGEVAQLGTSLGEPLRTVFAVWWTRRRPVRQIAAELGRTEHEVKDLLARAKAAVWRLAQEARRP